MNFFDLQNSFKRYFIFEKGNKPKSYRSILATLQMLERTLGSNDISDLSTDVIRSFLLDLREKRGWKPRTFRNHRQNLKSFLDWCVKEQIIKNNPVSEIEKPKLDKPCLRALTKQQTKEILRCVDWHNWRYFSAKVRNVAIIYTFVMTGIRLSELLNLKNNHVNLESGEIFIQNGKGNKDRIVPIHPQLMDKLQSYINNKQTNSLYSEWFFSSIYSDAQLTAKDVRTVCKKISKDADVYFTPHMLRHTFGRLAVEADLNLYKIQMVMGHEQITTTQRYLSVANESIKKSFFDLHLI